MVKGLFYFKKAAILHFVQDKSDKEARASLRAKRSFPQCQFLQNITSDVFNNIITKHNILSDQSLQF